MTILKTLTTILLAVVLLCSAPFSAMAAGNALSADPAKVSVEKTLRETTRRVQKLPSRRRQGANQALNLMRTQSPELCRLTGIAYMADTMIVNEANAQILADGEDLTEEEGDVAETDVVEVDQDGVVIGDEGEDIEELEEESPEEQPVDITSFRSLWLNYVDADGDDITAAGVEKQQLMNVVLDWLGTKYRFGGTTRRGIDCSAFMQLLYRETAEMELPRTANTQFDVGERIKDPEELQFGDLIFFKTRRYARITHVGMYLGDHLFAHASSRYGVTISSLESDYYARRFKGGSRITDRDMIQMEIQSASLN